MTRLDETKNKTRQKTRQDKRQDKTSQGKTRQDKTRKTTYYTGRMKKTALTPGEDGVASAAAEMSTGLSISTNVYKFGNEKQK